MRFCRGMNIKIIVDDDAGFASPPNGAGQVDA